MEDTFKKKSLLRKIPSLEQARLKLSNLRKTEKVLLRGKVDEFFSKSVDTNTRLLSQKLNPFYSN